MNDQDDWLIIDFPAIYGASKSRDYRSRVAQQFTVIFKFLKDNELMRIDPLDENDEVRLDLIVYGRDCEPIGIQMFAKAIPNWLKARDKDQNVANLGLLEKGLAKLRS
jgi:hypothetical protein